MAAAVAPPVGWNASGKQINDPVQFLESVLVPIIEANVKGDHAPSTYIEFEDIKNNNGAVTLHKEDYHMILPQTFPDNQKEYQVIPSLGLTRISADGNGNCFFDSFLTIMSPTYRTLSIEQRRPVMAAFRKWCETNSQSIIQSIPKKILSEKFASYSDTTGDKLKAELNRRVNTTINVRQKNSSGKNVIVKKPVVIDEEIDFEVGYLIAWYFGINLVFLATPEHHDMYPDSTNYEALCNTAYQSPSCKVGFIAFSGNHFEPLIDAKFTEDGKLNEKDTAFLFQWQDPRLCLVKTVAERCLEGPYSDTYKSWTEPGCAAAGGGKRRRHRRAKTRRVKRRRTTRRR